jgi:uncharacterized protein YjbJ (UPF0337 family)
MAGRTTRAKGRIKESAGALADDKELKDKGRLDQAKGSIRKRANKLRKRLP